MKVKTCKTCGKDFSKKSDWSNKYWVGCIYCSSKCANSDVERLKKLSDVKIENPNRYWLNKHRDEETRKKISISLKGVVPWIKGKKHTEETRKKMSLMSKGLPKLWLRGRKLSETHKKHLSEHHADFHGDKGPGWKGGLSFEPYTTDWTDTLKRSIRERDGYVCQVCGVHQRELNYKLHCHHIDYDKKNCDPKNLISLCRKCHMRTGGNRPSWVDVFRQEGKSVVL